MEPQNRADIFDIRMGLDDYINTIDYIINYDEWPHNQKELSTLQEARDLLADAQDILFGVG